MDLPTSHPLSREVDTYSANPAECRSCHARIVFARTAATGSPMPIDMEPVEHGTIALTREPEGLTATVIKDNDREAYLALATYKQLHTSHFATCPNAKQHRRPR